MAMMAAAKPIPKVNGIPLVGNTFEMAKDPAAFFLRGYREYGPVFRVSVFGREQIVIAGPEAAMFMTARTGRDALRSKEFWADFVAEQGGTRVLTGVDGPEHEQMRRIMRAGFSKEAIAGQYHRITEIIDNALARDWQPGSLVPVVEAFQFMVVQQLGEILTGSAPLDYVRDIRTHILFILNVLVTRQRPKWMLHHPAYNRAKKRVQELQREMLASFREREEQGQLPDNLMGDIMRANTTDPDLFPDQDIPLLLTGPYVAGLDTVANTLAAAVYGILKTPGVKERVEAEADVLFARGTVTEADVRGLVAINGCIMEAMRLWPIAVAQMRTATSDFEFEGHIIPEGSMIFIGTSVPHFMEEYFPDPERFDPDRYQRPRAEHLQRGAYSPFGRGPHSYLGQSLAEVQMAISIARLFHRREMALETPDYVLKTKTAPTPGPAMNFKIRVIGDRNPATPLTPEVQPEKSIDTLSETGETS